MTPPPAENVAEPRDLEFEAVWVRIIKKHIRTYQEKYFEEQDLNALALYRAMLAAAPAPSVAQSEREACPLCERDAASRPNSDEREGDDQRLLGLTKADPSALAWLKQLKVWAYWHYNERAAALYATHQARASAGSATTSTSDPIAPLSSYSFDELREGLRRMRAVRREQNRRSLWHRR